VKDHRVRIKKLLLLATCLIGTAGTGRAQELEADFRLRFYNDKFLNTMDNRGTEDYIRYLARIRAKWDANAHASFYNELITFLLVLQSQLQPAGRKTMHQDNAINIHDTIAVNPEKLFRVQDAVIVQESIQFRNPYPACP